MVQTERSLSESKGEREREREPGDSAGEAAAQEGQKTPAFASPPPL